MSNKQIPNVPRSGRTFKPLAPEDLQQEAIKTIEVMEEQKQAKTLIAQADHDWQSSLGDWKKKMRRKSCGQSLDDDDDDGENQNDTEFVKPSTKKFIDIVKSKRPVLNAYPFSTEDEQKPQKIEPDKTKVDHIQDIPEWDGGGGGAESKEKKKIWKPKVAPFQAPITEVNKQPTQSLPKKQEINFVKPKEKEFSTPILSNKSPPPVRRGSIFDRDPIEEEKRASIDVLDSSSFSKRDKQILDKERRSSIDNIKPKSTYNKPLSSSVKNSNIANKYTMEDERLKPINTASKSESNPPVKIGSIFDRDPIEDEQRNLINSQPTMITPPKLVPKTKVFEENVKTLYSLDNSSQFQSTKRGSPDSGISGDGGANFGGGSSTPGSVKTNEDYVEVSEFSNKPDSPQKALHFTSSTKKHSPDRHLFNEKDIFIQIDGNIRKQFGFGLVGGLEENKPLIVNRVQIGSAADINELQEGDEIVSINKTSVLNRRRLSIENLIKSIESDKKPKVNITIRRFILSDDYSDGSDAGSMIEDNAISSDKHSEKVVDLANRLVEFKTCKEHEDIDEDEYSPPLPDFPPPLPDIPPPSDIKSKCNDYAELDTLSDSDSTLNETKETKPVDNKNASIKEDLLVKKSNFFGRPVNKMREYAQLQNKNKDKEIVIDKSIFESSSIVSDLLNKKDIDIELQTSQAPIKDYVPLTKTVNLKPISSASTSDNWSDMKYRKESFGDEIEDLQSKAQLALGLDRNRTFMSTNENIVNSNKYKNSNNNENVNNNNSTLKHNFLVEKQRMIELREENIRREELRLKAESEKLQQQRLQFERVQKPLLTKSYDYNESPSLSTYKPKQPQPISNSKPMGYSHSTSELNRLTTSMDFQKPLSIDHRRGSSIDAWQTEKQHQRNLSQTNDVNYYQNQAQKPIRQPNFRTYNQFIEQQQVDDLPCVSSQEQCANCQLYLGSGAAMFIESLGLHYHLNCFSCSICGRRLASGNDKAADVRVKGKSLHCGDCYSKEQAGFVFSQV